MNLIEQLRSILAEPGVLPVDPSKPIRGLDLFAKIKDRVSENYALNSVLQTFSYLAKDSTSPLARVEGKHGYYRRPIVSGGPPMQVHVDSTDAAAKPTNQGRSGQREERFRAFYRRFVQLNSSFPVFVEHTSGAHQPAGVNKWKFPDLVVLDWEVGEQRDDAYVLDEALLEVKRSLGEQPFRLASVELKVEISFGNFREYFFQCVSNSKWAHLAQLVVAAPIDDALLANELRRLGASYGVSISSYAMSREQIDELPPAHELMKMSDEEFEKLSVNIEPVSIATGVPRFDLDWDHLRDMRLQSREFRDLFDWIARCLRDAKAYRFEKYLSLREIESETG